MRNVITLLVMVYCLLWGCLDRVERSREEQDAIFKHQRCVNACGAAHDLCLRRSHASGACYQHHADCQRECP